MEDYINIKKGSRFTADNLRTLSTKALTSLATASPSVEIHADARAFLALHKITSADLSTADRTLILRIANEKATGTLYEPGNFEEKAWPAGASVRYTPQGVIISKPAENDVVFKAAPIPVQEVRPGLVNLIVLLTSLFRIKSGKIVRVIQNKDLIARFDGPNSAIDPFGVEVISGVLAGIAKKSLLMQQHVEHGDSLEGYRFANFVKLLLMNASLVDYLALQTVVSLDFVKSYEPDPKKPKEYKYRECVNSKGAIARIIPEKSVVSLAVGPSTPLPLKEAIKEFTKATKLPSPFLLVGDIPTQHKFVSPKNATVKEAHVAMQSGITFRGGVENGMGTFLQGDGFSSLSSVRHNRMCLLSAMVLSVASHPSHKGQIDVEVEIGQLPIVHSTLAHYLPDWKNVIRYINGTPAKASNDLLDYVFKNTTPGAHYVAYSDVPVPTVNTGREVDTSFKDAFLVHLKRNPYKNFTICMPITVEDMFKDNVYAFRGPVDFRGIWSSLPGLEFRTTEMRAGKEEMVTYFKPAMLSGAAPADAYKHWLSLVVSANIRYNGFFLAPKTFFHELSNILVPPSRGVKMEFEAETGWTFVTETVKTSDMEGWDVTARSEVDDGDSSEEEVERPKRVSSPKTREWRQKELYKKERPVQPAEGVRPVVPKTVEPAPVVEKVSDSAPPTENDSDGDPPEEMVSDGSGWSDFTVKE